MTQQPNPLAPPLLAWFSQAARHLPWRENPTPYAVWVSEIMLQQTRVDTVLPYYTRWMRLFPDVYALAEAGQQDVLNAWEGLGYYSRARNLHRAARLIVQHHSGRLPADRRALLQLPGIGEYTAAAILSIAFGQDIPAMDANLRRVFARLFDVDTPLGQAATEERLRSLAAAHLPSGRAGEYNQALMDLGALVCTPRIPSCAACPLKALCLARRRGVQNQRPVKAQKKPRPHYKVVAAVIWRNGQVLLARRPENGLLGGLWEFPGGKVQPGETFPAALQREIREELGADIEVETYLGTYRHAFTHFSITLRAYTCRLHPHSPPPAALEHTAITWQKPQALDDFPMGKVDRQIARRLQQGADRVSG
ncbi:MAG: A/G-specific adenine glycosylase [Anaerolineae bacterium]|nr:MAG: A/G-specific adenine glycosylase [Anaerolineae bacterium]